MVPRSEKLIFYSVLIFRRVTHFWLCLLETQVTLVGLFHLGYREQNCTIYFAI